MSQTVTAYKLAEAKAKLGHLCDQTLRGRPARILLCELVDRGGRELPIHADIVGLSVTTGPDEQVEVRVRELDGEDGVYLLRAKA